MRLALAGGGTGGHVVPGLHLLAHLCARGAAPSDVLWFCAGRPVEDAVLRSARERLGNLALDRVVLDIEPEKGGAPSWMRLAARTPVEASRAANALARHRSEVLLALGGFTALPAVLAARSQGIPVVLLEVNAVPGKATRTLAGLAERVVHVFPVAKAPGTSSTARHATFGAPLGPDFTARASGEEESARERAHLGFDPGRPLLLVLGGSQGAAPLNRFVRVHARELTAAGVQVLHQTGPGRLAEAAPFRDAGYRAVEYLDGMARVLDAATLVLCRGGASTLAEIAARARPALVVPYPHHRDRHQERNALALGAGVRVVPEERLGPELVTTVARLAGPDGRPERAAMERALAAALPADGAPRLANELLKVAARFRTT